MEKEKVEFRPLTDAEEKRLEYLLSRKEEQEKRDKDFFKEVKKRRKEVLKCLEVSEGPSYADIKVKNIASKYDCSEYDLLDWIETDSQIDYYLRKHLQTAIESV